MSKISTTVMIISILMVIVVGAFGDPFGENLGAAEVSVPEIAVSQNMIDCVNYPKVTACWLGEGTITWFLEPETWRVTTFMVGTQRAGFRIYLDAPELEIWNWRDIMSVSPDEIIIERIIHIEGS